MKIYIDWLSQPCRTVAIYCLMEKIPHEIVEARINNQEQRKPEYVKISPTAKVPAMSETLEDGQQFNLVESHTIIRYLSDKFKKYNLYPSQDIQLKAIVNSYLDWHHLNTRRCGGYIFDVYFAHFLGETPKYGAQKLYPEIEQAFLDIEQIWLDGGKNKFIGNNKQLTVADISCYCEVMQMVIDKYDFQGKFPILHEWMQRIGQVPEIQKLHQVLFKFAPKLSQYKQKPSL